MKNMEEKIIDEIDKAIERLADKDIVIYGCTVFTPKIYAALRQRGIAVSAIVDNDGNKAGKKYLGINVFFPYQYLLPYDQRKLVIVCSIHEDDMIHSLQKMGYGDGEILHISSKMEVNTDTLECAVKQMEIVRRGMDSYEKMSREFGRNTTILIAPKASGDIFLACSYLQAWRLKYGISDYMLVGVGPNLEDVADMYGVSRKTRIVPEEEWKDLITAYTFCGKLPNVKLLSEWAIKIRNSYFPRNRSLITFRDKFKYETFRLGKEVTPEYPDSHGALNQEICHKLKKGGTVIIAPYAYSSPAPVILPGIWAEIAFRLQRKGYIVYTVGYGEKEPAIKDTERLQFPYSQARNVLEYAGNFLASRSGLCDIVHMAECRQLVIYGRNIRNEYAIDFFNLHRNYPEFHGEEIVFDDYETGEFIQYIVDYF